MQPYVVTPTLYIFSTPFTFTLKSRLPSTVTCPKIVDPIETDTVPIPWCVVGLGTIFTYPNNLSTTESVQNVCQGYYPSTTILTVLTLNSTLVVDAGL